MICRNGFIIRQGEHFAIVTEERRCPMILNVPVLPPDRDVQLRNKIILMANTSNRVAVKGKLSMQRIIGAEGMEDVFSIFVDELYVICKAGTDRVRRIA